MEHTSIIWRIQGIMVTVFLLMMVVFTSETSASWNLGMDVDARMAITDFDEVDAGIHVVGASLRKIITDSTGDRLILFALVEAHDDFSDWMLHEIYAQYKGPMGRWNITAGRFSVPYGLNTDYTTSRSMFDDLYPVTLGMAMDSGLMLSGVVRDIDYGVAVTQGHGAHGTPDFPGETFGTARLGYTFGDAGEYRFGISAATGRTHSKHHPDHKHHEPHTIKRSFAAIDATIEPGHWIARLELQAGEINDQSVIGGFGMMDYALLPRLDLNLAGRAIRTDGHTSGYAYVGASYRSAWFTFRGGYTYDTKHKDHILSFQIYRMFSIPF